MAHGCQAGLQQEAYEKVYFERIMRGRTNTTASTNLARSASDLGAVACFFDEPWIALQLCDGCSKQCPSHASRLLILRALGRLAEALEPMRAGLKWASNKRTGRKPAIRASNLSELELTLGEVAGAVGDAEQSVTYADRSGDAFQRMALRTTHADALHQAGRRAEAETRFREAEQMQKEDAPDYPLLYSVRGFRYCDLLLAVPERAAWQICLGSARATCCFRRPRRKHPGEPSALESSTPWANPRGRGLEHARTRALSRFNPAAPSPSARRRRSSGTKSAPRHHCSTSDCSTSRWAAPRSTRRSSRSPKSEVRN